MYGEHLLFLDSLPTSTLPFFAPMKPIEQSSRRVGSLNAYIPSVTKLHDREEAAL